VPSVCPLKSLTKENLTVEYTDTFAAFDPSPRDVQPMSYRKVFSASVYPSRLWLASSVSPSWGWWAAI